MDEINHKCDAKTIFKPETDKLSNEIVVVECHKSHRHLGSHIWQSEDKQTIIVWPAV